MKTIFFFLILLLLPFSCKKRIEEQSQSQKLPGNYEIYSFLIDSLYSTPHLKNIGIGDSTVFRYDSIFTEILQKKIPEINIDTLMQDLRQKNQTHYFLTIDSLTCKLPVTLVRRDSFVSYLYTEDARTITDLYKRKRVLSFSKIGIDSSRKNIIVYVEYRCGPRCGWGEFIFLNISGRWRILLRQTMWVT